MTNKTLARAYIGASALIAVMIAAIYSFLLIEQYDFSKGLWYHGTPGLLTALPYILLIPIAVLALVFGQTLKKAREEETVSASPFVKTRLEKPFSFAVAVGFLLTLAAQLAANGTGDKLGELLNADSVWYLPLTGTLHTITLILAIPAASYFVLPFFKKELTVASGLFTIAYFSVYALRVYFDMTMHINNPRWSFRVAALLSLLMYFVCEVHWRIRSGKKQYGYLLAAFVAMTLATVEGLSSLVLSLGAYVADGWELVYSVLALLASVYIAYRLFAMTLSNPSSSETVLSLKTADGESASDKEDIGEDVGEGEGEGEITLTADELRAFHAALCRTLAEKRASDGELSCEERKAIEEKAMGMIYELIDSEQRDDNIRYIRAFLAREEESK